MYSGTCRDILGVVSKEASTLFYFFPELTKFARLDYQRTPGVHQFPPLQLRVHHHADQVQVLISYQLSYLPSPSSDLRNNSTFEVLWLIPKHKWSCLTFTK